MAPNENASAGTEASGVTNENIESDSLRLLYADRKGPRVQALEKRYPSQMHIPKRTGELDQAMAEDAAEASLGASAAAPPAERSGDDLERPEAAEFADVELHAAPVAPVAAVGADADQITVLTASKLLVKAWRADGSISGYDNAKHYGVQQRPVRGIHELSELLRELESRSKSCIVRGRFVGQEEARKREPELKHPDKTFRRDALFDDCPLHAVLIEVDNFEPLTTDPVRDPAGAVDEYVATQLPVEFHGIACHWQLSNSAGHPDKPGLRAHIWFWLRTPYTSMQLKAWAEAIDLKADHSVFQKIQCHYTGAPIFEPGVNDAVPVRSGFLQGPLGDDVELQIDAAIAAAPAAERPTRSEKRKQAVHNDPIAQHLIERGYVKSEGAKGLNITCPFEGEHTGASADSSTIYFPPHTGGWERGHFKCLHAHCAERSRDEFLEKIGYAEGAGVLEGAAAEGALQQFYAYLPEHKYIHRPTRSLWPAASVDGRLDIKIDKLRPSAWLDKHRPVEQMTWWPGEPETIEGKIAAEGGWIERPGATIYNRYRAPAVIRGDAHAAAFWRDHIRAIYPDEADHIERWLAHRVQRPGEKINHALVLGGAQGIGKDTLLEPVKRTVGQWNWSEISAAQMLGAFNGWVQAVVTRVSEARDLGDVDRFAFYDHSKTYIAAPPDTISCNEKHTRAYPVVNVMGVIITTNHRTDGIYLPADDRRHFVAWSMRDKADFDEAYWTVLWQRLNAEGTANVAEFLRGLDLSSFNPKAPPPKTEAFYAIVAAGNNPDDVELSGLIDRMAQPDAVTVTELRASVDAFGDEGQLAALFDMKARRRMPHVMERVGYEQVRNPDAADGLWKVDGKRQAIYSKKGMPFAEQIGAAKAKVTAGRAA